MEGIDILEGMDSGAILGHPELIYLLTILNQVEDSEKHQSHAGISQIVNLNIQKEYLKIIGESKIASSGEESENIKSIINVIKRQRKILSEFSSQIVSTQNKAFSHLPKTVASNFNDTNLETVDGLVGQSIETIAGNNPSQWPSRVSEFLEELINKPFNVFFDQPFVLHSHYLKELELKTVSAINNLTNETNSGNEQINKEGDILVMIAEIIISLMRGSFNRTMNSISNIFKIEKHLNQQEREFLIVNLKRYLSKYIMELLKTARNPSSDFFINQSKELGCSAITDISSGEFKGGDSFCLCTDSFYIYELLSQNGVIELVKKNLKPDEMGQHNPLISKIIARNEQKHISMALIKENCMSGTTLMQATL